MVIYYIGAFPPNYGGVTIKNKNLYDALTGQMDIRKIDMNLVKRGNFTEMLRFGWAMLVGKQYVIGLAGQGNRRVFTKLMYYFKRKAMRRSIMLIMGGIVDDMLAAEYVKKLNTYRCVYVELPGMARKLEAAGAENVGIYPNGRLRPERLPAIAENGDQLQCVYFSIIQPEKGVGLTLQAAERLQEMHFHFYGEIQPSYQQEFLGLIAGKNNVTYHGIFKGDAETVYRELAKYDVLLLPTRWKAEGLPGILIEAKIAGLPAVISDHNFNREIVRHNDDGIILQKTSEEDLIASLRILDADRARLMKMKQAARKSAEEYYIDICAAQAVKDLTER